MMVAGDESPLIQAHEAKDHLGLRMLILCGGVMLCLAILFTGIGLYIKNRRQRQRTQA
jgi:hypothetical protein